MPDGQPRTILSDVSFEIPAGARVAVIGASGTGKTTLLRLMNRLDDPDSGTISLNGTDIRQLPPPVLRRKVGMVFQQPHLFDGTILDNLNRPLTLGGQPDLDRLRAEAALEQVHLPGHLLDQHSRDLSIGQQQRVALARALVLQPEVLLLDEPTSALDPRSADTVLSLLTDVASASGITLVMVSHAMDQAEAFATNVVAVLDGAVRMFDAFEPAVGWALPVTT